MIDANYEIATRLANDPSSTTRLEDAWAFSITTSRGFCYMAEPTPLVRHVLERVFGPLDYDVPYV